MKRLLVLSVLALGLAFVGGTFANAQCYPAPVVTVYRAPYCGYHQTYRHRVVRQAYFRPTYYHGYRPCAPRSRIVFGVGY